MLRRFPALFPGFDAQALLFSILWKNLLPWGEFHWPRIPKLWDVPRETQKRAGNGNLFGFLGMIPRFSWEFKMDLLPPLLQTNLGILVIPTWNETP